MQLLRDLWRILTLRCEDATRIASDAIDGESRLADRIAHRMHLISCRRCRRFTRQLQFLRLVLRRLATRQRLDPEHEVSLSPEAKDRIDRVLRDADRASDE